MNNQPPEIEGEYTVVEGQPRQPEREPFFKPGGGMVVVQILFWSTLLVLWKAWPYL